MSIEKSSDMATVMHSLGQLTGAVQAMHQGLTARIEDIRVDIRRVEAAHSDRMDRVEDTLSERIDAVEGAVSKQIDNLKTDLNARIDSLGKRVNNLEEEDKRLIDKTARLSALGGGIGGALAAGAVELIKRM